MYQPVTAENNSIIICYFLLSFFSLITWLLHKQEPLLLLLGRLMREFSCSTVYCKGFSFIGVSSRSWNTVTATKVRIFGELRI